MRQVRHLNDLHDDTLGETIPFKLKIFSPSPSIFAVYRVPRGDKRAPTRTSSVLHVHIHAAYQYQYLCMARNHHPRISESPSETAEVHPTVSTVFWKDNKKAHRSSTSVFLNISIRLSLSNFQQILR